MPLNSAFLSFPEWVFCFSKYEVKIFHEQHPIFPYQRFLFILSPLCLFWLFELMFAKGGRCEDGVRFVADFDLGVLKLLPPKFPRAKILKKNISHVRLKNKIWILCYKLGFSNALPLGMFTYYIYSLWRGVLNSPMICQRSLWTPPSKRCRN